MPAGVAVEHVAGMPGYRFASIAIFVCIAVAVALYLHRRRILSRGREASVSAGAAAVRASRGLSGMVEGWKRDVADKAGPKAE